MNADQSKTKGIEQTVKSSEWEGLLNPFLIRVYPCKSVADFSSCLATARPGVHAGERREAAGRSKEGSALQLKKKKVANLRARG
jgi:hypothetical protein